MKIKNKVRIALLEFEGTHQLNKTDKKVVDFIIGEGITEAGNDILTRFMNVVNSNQRKFITAAVMATLMATPSFSQALKTASPEQKNVITSFIKSEKSSQITKDEKAVFSLNFTSNFPSGRYEVSHNEISGKLESLKNFLSKNKGTNFTIKITASESQVPNQDNMKTGQLANLRAVSLEKAINVFLKGNDLSVNVDKETKIGNVPWDGKNKDDEKYSKDQYIRLDVYADAGKEIAPCEISFNKNDGSMSTAKEGYVSFEETINQSGSMNISPGSIPDRLVIIKGDNIIDDTGYFVDKEHGYEQWLYVPLYIAQLTKIYADSPNLPAISNIKEKKTFASFDELLKSLMKKNYNYSKDERSEIKEGIIMLKQLWDSGQREFIFYQMRNGNVDFNFNEGETGKIVVYSPIGKTGFKLNGNCD